MKKHLPQVHIFLKNTRFLDCKFNICAGSLPLHRSNLGYDLFMSNKIKFVKEEWLQLICSP